MKTTLSRLSQKFIGRGPLVNIILDGYGIGEATPSNAISQAHTPFLDHLIENYPNTCIKAHGRHVGLPGKTNLGGSEVGHMVMGAGRIVKQKPTKIKDSIADGSFFDSPVLKKAYQFAKNNHALHLIGLLSDGNVHSHINNFIAIIEGAEREGISHLYLHALLDGRDVGIQTADLYIRQVETLFQEVMERNPGFDYAIASAGGRELITMDRDKDWQKVELGWKTAVLGASGTYFNSALEGITHFRKEKPDIIDQSIPPFNIRKSDGKVPRIVDGDAVINVNFRGDRAIEITRAFVEEDFNEFEILHKPKVYFAGITCYDKDLNIPENFIVTDDTVKNPFGKRILELGLSQFRVAETQKFAHITFFFNGGYKTPLDDQKEKYFLIKSDPTDTFEDKPEMKAFEIAQTTIDCIRSGEYNFGLINFANADMVGHTGNLKAAIKAVEALDTVVQQICEVIKEVGGIAVITADHGNADEMTIINKDSNQDEVSAKHSINPVPFIIYDPQYKGEYKLKQLSETQDIGLSHIAATNFVLLGQAVPEDIYPSLFKLDD